MTKKLKVSQKKYIKRIEREEKRNIGKRNNKEDKPAKGQAKGKSKDKDGNSDDDQKNDDIFSSQLLALDLKLRVVLGDGNCLFRALGDQLEGHSKRHLQLRKETVHYMTTHRQDFEPFLAKDEPFSKYLSQLSEPGTFAGHHAIVAFARNQQLKVVIHQLRLPLWEINGTEEQLCNELHIAFRYGNHFDSVRRIGDNSESPAQLRIDSLQNVTTVNSELMQAYHVFDQPVFGQKPSTDTFETSVSKKQKRLLNRQKRRCQGQCDKKLESEQCDKKLEYEQCDQELQYAIWLSQGTYNRSMPEDTVTTLLPHLETLSISAGAK